MAAASIDALLGALLVAVGLVVAIVLILRSGLEPRERVFLAGGLVVSALGSLAYLFTMSQAYGGGDYLAYFAQGRRFAEAWSEGGWEDGLYSLESMAGSRQWWGTRFTALLTGLLMRPIGPSLPALFVVFGLMGYVGALCFWTAARRALPGFDTTAYLGWLLLFPSLWFWTGAIGKDAVVFLGTGLAVLGFVGKGEERVKPVPLVVGVALVFAIRPPVAATLAFALTAGLWLSTVHRFTFVRGVQSVVLLAMGVAVISLAGGSLGVELFEADAVTDYVDRRAGGSAIGGSAVGGTDQGVTPWLAPVNVLFRPFPWEATGVTGLLASAEMLLLWGLLWWRRRELRAFFRAYRHTRLLWGAVVFVIVYSTALGLSLGNFGIIARQRVHVLPFLLLFVVGLRAWRPAPRAAALPTPGGAAR